MAELIYVIEDEENIRELLQVALTSYSYEVQGFESAEEALEMMEIRKPDLAVFDIMLPKMDGITAVKQLRKQEKFNTLPIIMLTAKDSEIDKVAGLDCGADDYMTKPFGILELLARIRALLRRTAVSDTAAKEIIKSDHLVLNANTREVFSNGKQIELTFKEYELLRYLIQNKDRVATREELLNTIWGYDFIGETRTLDIHIRTLRKKVGEECIKTVRGVGYRFI